MALCNTATQSRTGDINMSAISTTIPHQFLRPKHVAAMLEVSTKTVRRMLREGYLEGMLLRGRWYLTEDCLQKIGRKASEPETQEAK